MGNSTLGHFIAIFTYFLVHCTRTTEPFRARYHANRVPNVCRSPVIKLLISKTMVHGTANIADWETPDLDQHGQLDILVNGDSSQYSSHSQSKIFHGESDLSSTQAEPVHDHVTPKEKTLVAITIAAAFLAFVGLLKAAGQGGWRYFLAGGICAATSHALTTPVDVVKTRKQVDPKLLDQSFTKATRTIVETEGLNALLSGLGPTTFGYLMEGAIKFGTYEVLKPFVGGLLATFASVTKLALFDSKVLGFVICGAASGMAASVVLCPMEALRIRVVAEPEFAPGGWIEGGLKMLKFEGVDALWKGLTPMLYKQVPYTIAKNVSFDVFTKLFYSFLHTGGHVLTGSTKVIVPLLSAIFASIVSCISSQPGDMLLSLVNAHEGRKRANDFIKEILESDHGMRGFFIGTKTRFLHVGLIVTLQLMIYDFIKRLCGVAATGTI